MSARSCGGVLAGLKQRTTSEC